MNKYERSNLSLVALLTVIFLISGALMYFLYFDKQIEKEDQTKKKDSIYVKVTDENIIKNITDTIDNNKLIILADDEKSIDNINAIPNDEKLELAYTALENTELTKESIDNYFKKAFDTNIYWNKDDIKCSCEQDLYIYNTELEKYEYNEEHLGHGLYVVRPFYSKVLDVEKKNDIYVIKMTYVWAYYGDLFDYINVGYASNEDVEKDIKLFELDIENHDDEEVDINYYAIKEIEDNYDKYKDKLHTYTYTFKYVDGNYLLQSFRFEK